MEIITTQLTSDSQAYSQAVRHAGLMYTGGQVGIDPETGIVATGITAQTHLALLNLKLTLEAGGSSLSQVLKMTCILSDMSLFSEFDAVFAEVFAGHKPARVTIAAGLAQNFLVEVDATAVCDS